MHPNLLVNARNFNRQPEGDARKLKKFEVDLRQQLVRNRLASEHVLKITERKKADAKFPEMEFGVKIESSKVTDRLTKKYLEGENAPEGSAY